MDESEAVVLAEQTQSDAACRLGRRGAGKIVEMHSGKPDAPRAEMTEGPGFLTPQVRATDKEPRYFDFESQAPNDLPVGSGECQSLPEQGRMGGGAERTQSGKTHLRLLASELHQHGPSQGDLPLPRQI